MKLELKELNRFYGNNHALKDYSYEFIPGIYGLLGENGAGKSTLMNILTGNLRASSGSVLLDGKDVVDMGREYRKQLGFMPQQQQVIRGFTLKRFLLYVSGLKGIPKEEAQRQIKQVAARVNLEDALDRRLEVFSGGMKQRALLAQALLGNPKILILDEPTAGLDPNERIRFRNIVSKTAFDRIVIIATHVVSDIQYIANRVIIMKEGCVTADGAPWQLCDEMKGKVFEIMAQEEQVEEIEKLYKVADMMKDYDGVRVRIVSDSVPEGYVFTEASPSLEDVYLFRV